MSDEDNPSPSKESSPEIAPKKDPPKKKKPSDIDLEFEEIIIKDADGKDVKKFKCNLCDQEASVISGMKRHVAAKHKKVSSQSQTNTNKKLTQKKDKPEPEKTAEEPFNYDLLNLDNEEDGGSQSQTQSFDLSPMRPGQGTPEISNLVEARDRIANLEKELAVAIANSQEDEAKLESLDLAMKDTKKEGDIIKARNDTLEIEAMENDEKITRFIRKFQEQDIKIKNLEKEHDENETNKKLKEVKDELKKKKKELESSDKKVEEFRKKLKDETNARALAEATSEKLNNATRILEKEKETRKENERSKEREERRHRNRQKSELRSHEREDRNTSKRSRSSSQGRKSRSKDAKRRRSHSKSGSGEKKKMDCKFWVSSKCKFSETFCKFKHDPRKKRISGDTSGGEEIKELRRKEPKRQEPRRQEASRRYEDSRRNEDSRRLNNSRRQNNSRNDEESRSEEESRMKEQQKEKSRKEEDLKRLEDKRRQDELKRLEDEKRKDDLQREEYMRRQDDLRRQEEFRRIEELRRQEQARRQEVLRSPNPNPGFLSPLTGAVGQGFPVGRVLEPTPQMMMIPPGQPGYAGQMMWTDQGAGARWAGLR